jgi:hypothetical protein
VSYHRERTTAPAFSCAKRYGVATFCSPWARRCCRSRSRSPVIAHRQHEDVCRNVLATDWPAPNVKHPSTAGRFASAVEIYAGPSGFGLTLTVCGPIGIHPSWTAWHVLRQRCRVRAHRKRSAGDAGRRRRRRWCAGPGNGDRRALPARGLKATGAIDQLALTVSHGDEAIRISTTVSSSYRVGASRCRHSLGVAPLATCSDPALRAIRTHVRRPPSATGRRPRRGKGNRTRTAVWTVGRDHDSPAHR